MLKKVVAICLSFAVAFSTVGEIKAGEIKVGGITTQSYEEMNDPEYAKYQDNNSKINNPQFDTLKAYGDGLTHDECFSKSKRVYGVDVSKWQKTIDWKKVKASGIDFAIIRLGYRGSADGTLNTDEYFETNVKGAHAAGIKVGIYFFTNAITASEAKAEANYCIKKLKDYSSYITMPVMYDIEEPSTRTMKAKLSKTTMTKMCKSFCETIEAGGYRAGVYSSKSFLEGKLKMSDLANYYTWCARYNTICQYFSGVREGMWQYSSSGKVSGITTGSADMDVAYIETTPAKPKNVVQTTTTVNSIKLKWDKVTYADGYDVALYDINENKIAVLDTNTNSITIDNLELGTAYKAKVRSYYVYEDESVVKGKYCALSDIFTLPDKVTNIVVTERTANSLSLKWDDSKGALKYRVRQLDPETGTYTTLATTYTNSARVEGLKEATKYPLMLQAYVRLADGTTNKYGEQSDDMQIYTTVSPVEKTKVDIISTNGFTISWDAKEGIEKYKVICKDVEGTEVDSRVVTTNKYSLDGLGVGKRYTVSIFAIYEPEEGHSYNGMAVDFEARTVAGKITNIKQSDATTSKIVLSWDAVESACGYNVYAINSDGSKTLVKTVDTNKCTISGLTAGTKHTYVVKGYVEYNSVKYEGEESDSYEASVKPSAISAVKVASVSSDAAELKWSKVKNATGYRVYLYDSESKLITSFDTGDTEFIWTSLESAKVHSFKVRAFVNTKDTVILGDKTSLIKFKTGPASVGKIKSTPSTTSVKLSWDKVDFATGYNIYMYDSSKKAYKLIKSTTSNSYTVSKLSKAKKYKFKVVSYVTYKSTKYTGTESKVYAVYTKPDKVKKVALTGRKKTSVNFCWSAVKKAKAYAIYRKNSSGKYVKIAETEYVSFIDTGLSSKKTYYYKVRAILRTDDKTTYGDKSDALKVTTK